jgi:hypothetical protein
MVIITLEIKCELCRAILSLQEPATRNDNPLFQARFYSRSKGWDARDDDSGKTIDLCSRCRMVGASKASVPVETGVIP